MVMTMINVKKERPQNKYLKPAKPGEVRNPAGRPKGSRSKFSENFCHDLLLEWQEGGRECMRRVREEDPSTFLRVAASLLPKEFNINDRDASFDRFINGLDDNQLEQLIAGLCAVGGSGKDAALATEAGDGTLPDKVH
jgi:hypothetical protein